MATALQKLKKTPRSFLGWGLGCFAAVIAAVVLVYYWRVFYYFDRVPAATLTFYAVLAALLVYGAFFIAMNFLKSFNAKATAAIFICGLVFCFANPPIQAPDESAHYLRAYAISMGRFDFDAERTYPTDVDILLQEFPGAWATAHDGMPVKIYYTLEGEGENAVKVEQSYYSILTAFREYASKIDALESGAKVPAAQQNEPLVVMVLPYIPQALGMLIARLLGFSALGCLYGGRIANLVFYAFLCYFALQNCKRYKPLFLAFMLLPMSLFLSASLSYDSLLLALYYLLASFYCKDEITDKDMVLFFVAFILVNAVKPWINLLWLALPLVLPKDAWKTKHKKTFIALASVLLAVGVTFAVSWYGRHFRYNYGEVGRMIEGVAQIDQLKFILSNIPRFIAVCIGTLYENSLFLGQLGIFGAIDLEISLVNILSPAILMLGTALSVQEKSSLRLKPALGLFGIAAAYIGGVLAALYITYTPVGMVRIIGLQARYFLPAWLLLCVLLAALLSHVLAPAPHRGEKAHTAALYVCVGFALLAGVLLFQHYCVGPVGEVLVQAVLP